MKKNRIKFSKCSRKTGRLSQQEICRTTTPVLWDGAVWDPYEKVKEYYETHFEVYPNVTPDGTTDTWEPHYEIIGEIVDRKGDLK